MTATIWTRPWIIRTSDKYVCRHSWRPPLRFLPEFRTPRPISSLCTSHALPLYMEISVFQPDIHISEGAAPCPIYPAPCPNYLQNVIAIFLFSSSCKCLQICAQCPRFHRSPTKLCPDLVSFAYQDCDRILVIDEWRYHLALEHWQYYLAVEHWR